MENKTIENASETLRNRECCVNFGFDLSKISLEDLFTVERILAKMGIKFDTGAGCGVRDWELDWSLRGPVKIYFRGDRECVMKKFNENH